MSHAVMLRPGWPGIFHRSVRDEKGVILKTLDFAQGDPQLLDDAEFAAVKKDLGNSLVMAHVDSDGIPTGKVAVDKPEPRKVVAAKVEPPVAKAKPDIEQKPATTRAGHSIETK